MDVLLWILASILALAMLGSGTIKVARDKAALQSMGLAWTADFPLAVIKAIGVAEILGAIGLIVPAAVHILPVLTPIAASCIAAVMAGAFVVHLRRGDGLTGAAPAALLLILAVVAAWGRFGPYTF